MINNGDSTLQILFENKGSFIKIPDHSRNIGVANWRKQARNIQHVKF